VTRQGGCSCEAVRFAIDGPVRDVITCHCDSCRAAAGGPWPASAALRDDFALDDPDALVWEAAAGSAHGASRGFCRTCRDYVLWDAPGRTTVSFAAALLDDGDARLGVAAHIWVPEAERAALEAGGARAYGEGLPDGVALTWHDETRSTG
jgi:hypothetical protein